MAVQHSLTPRLCPLASQGVIANVRRYIKNNNQEINRGYVSENVDERTERELHQQPFSGAVEGGVLGIMCSYNNKINGVWSCEDGVTLGQLKNTTGMGEGRVASDCCGSHSTGAASHAGLDQQIPDGSQAALVLCPRRCWRAWCPWPSWTTRCCAV